MQRGANTGRIGLVCAVLWTAACAGRSERSRDTSEQVRPANEPVAPFDSSPAAGRADAGLATTDTADSALPQTVTVEQAEAYEIRVRILTAVRVEADQLEAPKQQRSASNPTPKDVGWGRLQGHSIQVDHLVAHSVRAHRVIAQEIQARSISKLQAPLRWSAPTAGGPQIQNQCVSALDGGASDECFRERAF